MKKIIAILLALAVVSMAFAQTVSVSNTLSTEPVITIDGGNHYWGFGGGNTLREEVVGEAVTADGRAKVKGRIRFDLQTLDPSESSVLNLKPRWSWNSKADAHDGNRSSVAALLKPFDWLEVGIGNLDDVGYAFGVGPNFSWANWSDKYEWGFNTIIGLAGKWQGAHSLIKDGIQVAYVGVPGLKVGFGLASAFNETNQWGAQNYQTMVKKGVFRGPALAAQYSADLFNVGVKWSGNFGATANDATAAATTTTAAGNDKAAQEHQIYAAFEFKGLNEAKIGTSLYAAVGYYMSKASPIEFWDYYDNVAGAVVTRNNTAVSSFLFGVGAGFNFRNGISDDVAVTVGYNKIGSTTSKVLPFCVRNNLKYSVSSDANFNLEMCYSQNGLAEKTIVKGTENTNAALLTTGAAGAALTPTTDNDFGWLIAVRPAFSFSMGAHSFNFAVQTVVFGDIVPHAKSGHEWSWTGLRGRKANVGFPISWGYKF